MSSIFRETLPPPNPADRQAEGSLTRRICEKKIAMGHNVDDHGGLSKLVNVNVIMYDKYE